jgi:type II secretory pathway component PulC
MDTTVTEHQKRNQESKNTSIDKVENNKHPSAEEERDTVRNKLKEDLQIMCHQVRILQMSEREKLPKFEEKKTEN